ncbi:DUF1501 domain-containing protein [soil metagenome]
MNKDRREFLLKSCGALSMGAVASQMRHLGMMSAAAQSAIDSDAPAIPSDYRALVCIFMQGGNDGNNMVIPNHTVGSSNTWDNYNNVRSGQGLSLTQAQLANTSINVPIIGNLAYALHPGFGVQTPATNIVNNGIHELWDLGKLAAVTNVGTLVTPTTRTTYLNNSVPKPYQLFSHSDQVSQYQGGRSDSQVFTGWGGRISDLRSAIDNPAPPALIPMITSIAGAQLFTSGQFTLPMAIADSNTSLQNVLNPVGFGTNAAEVSRKSAFNALRQQDIASSSNYIAAASKITDLAISANNALQPVTTLTTPFPNTSIGRQLKQTALMIKKRNELFMNRQIFYVQLGSFDTHTNQLATQSNLLIQLSQAMRAFYDEMTVQGIADKVTQFTMADFSRTFVPAGTGSTVVGSDHAWGNHMLVVGGGVTAKNFYGMNGSNGTPYPQLSTNTADDSDNGTAARGRWVPATSVEQYAATLARWFGVPTADMATVFPKLPNFSNSGGINTDLGFMQPPAP